MKTTLLIFICVISYIGFDIYRNFYYDKEAVCKVENDKKIKQSHNEIHQIIRKAQDTQRKFLELEKTEWSKIPRNYAAEKARLKGITLFFKLGSLIYEASAVGDPYIENQLTEILLERDEMIKMLEKYAQHDIELGEYIRKNHSNDKYIMTLLENYEDEAESNEKILNQILKYAAKKDSHLIELINRSVTSHNQTVEFIKNMKKLKLYFQETEN